MYILTEKNDLSYDPVGISEQLDRLTDGLEYYDVAHGSYQIWEYPKGKIYDVRPDRRLSPDENQFTTPYTTKGTIWLPELVEVATDTEKVSEAYKTLQSH